MSGVNWPGFPGTPQGNAFAGARPLLTLDKLDLFHRADPYSVAFSKKAAGAVSIKAGTVVEVFGQIYTYHNETPILMPTLAAGDDLATWILPTGQPVATTSHVSPPVANSRKIGGFHHAPGGNAPAQAGGDTTPAINEYSLWDERFRPTAPDPRGMRKDPLGWATIYGLGVDHIVNGPSKYNVTLADGSSPPKIPLSAGGNGSTAYSTFNWWEAAEVLAKIFAGTIAEALIIVFSAVFLWPAHVNAAECDGQSVIASWYGTESGNRTANGEHFDDSSMTAAHKTLPFGTRLRVTYRGKSVMVRINDRGPFIRGRSLDLSRAAAGALGLIPAGVGRVCIERVG